MKQTYSQREKIGQFLLVLFPILVTQLSYMATGFFDTVMSGNASYLDLAGVAIGANIWLPVFAGMNGILVGITPIVAQLHGANRKAEMPFKVIQGIYLAAILALIVIIGGAFMITPILNLMKLDQTVHRIAYEFLAALSIGILPFFIASVLRNFIEALGYTRVTMLISLCMLPINIMLNYLLIFGNFGFPRLGGVGAGYASAITYWCMAFISVIVVHFAVPFKGYHIFSKAYRVSRAVWQELLALGLPIGFSIFCEVSIFGAVALLMAEFGTETIAAHQSAINFAGLIYMVPLSIGMALTIVVGFEVGAQRYSDAWQYSYLGLGMAILISGLSAIGLFSLGDQIAALYTQDLNVHDLIRNFLVYAIFFQFSDAVAAPIQGALRGYKDVKVTLVMSIVSYWIIGMPLGYVLAKYFTFGPYGYWIGFIVGLAVGAVALFGRLVRIRRKYITSR